MNEEHPVAFTDGPKTYPNPFLAQGWPPKPVPGFVFLSASRK
ncbi:hypothetical protein [Bifidobacterium thermophilum]|nr:hypothetical protein [Bifidobacterium thermophilum]